MKDFISIDIPEEESVFITHYIEKYNITVSVKKLKEPESHAHLINRINNEINNRFDRFEQKVKEYNQFIELSIEDKSSVALQDWATWHGVEKLNNLTDKMKKEIIDRYIMFKLEKPTL